MTITTMTCERFGSVLMDYLERDTDEATRVAVERHAVACAACGALLADLRRLERDAANLPDVAPARDLWTGIAARIETPVVAIGPSAGSAAARRRPVARRLVNAGLLAASLAGAVMVGYSMRGAPAGSVADVGPQPSRVDTLIIREPVTEVASVGTTPITDTVTVTQRPAAPARPSVVPVSTRSGTVLPAAALLTADYDREIAALRKVIQDRRVQLDSTTLAVIERNLAVIDSAIADSRQAITRDPASPYLIELLNQSLQTKVELMRTAALLPSRT